MAEELSLANHCLVYFALEYYPNAVLSLVVQSQALNLPHPMPYLALEIPDRKARLAMAIVSAVSTKGKVKSWQTKIASPPGYTP